MPAAAAERPAGAGAGARMQTTLSAWTPLNHPMSNNKVFEERRILLAKWFDRWSDSQRRAVLADLVLSCSPQQLAFLSGSVSRRLPLQAADFTCMLPRSLCVHLFSFLDPRSLCRCARVSWHWRSIVELDRLWTPRCQRLGWRPSFTPRPLEQGVWKRLYVQTVQELRLQRLQSAQQQQLAAPPAASSRDPEVKPDSAPPSRPQGPAPRRKQPAAGPPPWRDSDRHPKDTLRFNYLDNPERAGPAVRGQVNMKGSAHQHHQQHQHHQNHQQHQHQQHHQHHHQHHQHQQHHQNHQHHQHQQHQHHQHHQQHTWAHEDAARRSTPQMFLTSHCRPPKPSSSPPPPQPPPGDTQYHRPPLVGVSTTGAPLRVSCWGPEVLSAPVRSAMLRAAQRSHRSPPSQPLFPALPWTEATLSNT